MDKDCKKLIDHISRLEGQLASVKRELQGDEINCSKTAKTILAASRSFATLKMNFIATFLESKFKIRELTKDQEMVDDLLSVIKG